jgi:hypothetical protein
MDYLKIYNSLIDNSKNKTFDKDQYFETHHVIPKCLGGTDNKNNLVKLTAREHFVAHWILFRLHPTNKQIAAAFHIITFGTNSRNTRKKHNGYIPSSRAIAEAREAKVLHNKGSKHSEDTITKMKNTWKDKIENGYISPTKGKITSDDTKEKQRQAKLGKNRSTKVIEKIRNTKLENTKEQRELKIKLREDKLKLKLIHKENVYQERKLNDILKCQMKRNTSAG